MRPSSHAGRPGGSAPGSESGAGLDQVRELGIDLRLESAAVEDAVVAGACLNVMAAHVGPETRAEIVGGDGLADRADVVLLALDGEQGRPPDGAGIDAVSAPVQTAPGQQVLLEHAAHRLE